MVAHARGGSICTPSCANNNPTAPCCCADPHEAASKYASNGVELTPAMVRRQIGEAVDSLRAELRAAAVPAAAPPPAPEAAPLGKAA